MLGMLRDPQHERKIDNINSPPFVLSTRRRTPERFFNSLLDLWLSYIVSAALEATRLATRCFLQRGQYLLR
jgi:hypothetical protein